jgi:surface protein
MMNAMGVTTITNLRKLKLDNATFPVNSNAFFLNLNKVDEISLKNVDTSYTTDMGQMFSGVTNVEELDISSFDTSSVTNMTTMFNGCTNLKTIKVSRKFKTDRVITSTTMFSDSTQLVGGNGTTYDANHVDKEYARIDTNDTPGYFTLKTPASNFGNLTSSIRNTANKIANIKE